MMSVSQVRLGEQGPRLSRLIFGVWRMAQWNLDRAQRLQLIEGCLERGVTTFDHADIYGGYTCEALFGEALAQAPHLRQNMQIISKCGIKLVSPNRPAHRLKSYDTSRAHIVASVENSLQMLRTDYLDVLLIHRPDPMLDAEETASAFEELRQAGKVLHFGVSNFSPGQVNLLSSRLAFPLVTNQVEISVLHLEAFRDGTLDHCQERRIAPMAWSPLAGGQLFEAQDERAKRVRAVLEKMGDENGGFHVDQVALAWLFAHPAGILPVLGTSQLSRVEQAAQAEKLKLSREQWFEVWMASTGAEVP